MLAVVVTLVTGDTIIFISGSEQRDIATRNVAAGAIQARVDAIQVETT